MRAVAITDFKHKKVNYFEGGAVELGESELKALALVGLVELGKATPDGAAGTGAGAPQKPQKPETPETPETAGTSAKEAETAPEPVKPLPAKQAKKQ